MTKPRYSKHARFALLLLSFLLVACPPPPPNARPVDFSSADSSVTARGYPKILRLWSRHQEDFFNPIRVYVDAVYYSWQFRQAKIAYLSKNFALSQEQVDLLLEEEKQRYNQCHEFFIKFYTDPMKLNDLNLKESQWSVSLTDNRNNTATAAPTDIKKLSNGGRYLSAADRLLFDSLNLDNFSNYYRVCIPRLLADGTPLEPTGPGGTLTLRFSSAIAKVELTWISK